MVIEFDGEAWSQFEELLRRFGTFSYVVKLRLASSTLTTDVKLVGVRDDRSETVLLYRKYDAEADDLGCGEVLEASFDLVDYVYVY